MSLLSHVSDVAFASSIPTDLILGTYSGSFSVAAPTATAFPSKTSNSTTFQTGIPEKTFFQGVFSVDGGVTWVDFNSNVAVLLGTFSNLQTQMAYAYSKPGTITVVGDNWNRTSDGITFSASAYTFMYKVVLFAMPGQGNITPQTITQQRSFSSFYNYQKIYRDSIYNFNLPTTTSTSVINHDLGYVPKFRSYIDNFSYSGSPDNNALFDFGYFVSQYVAFQAYMDNPNTISYFVDNSFAVSNLTGTLYTRIYYNDN